MEENGKPAAILTPKQRKYLRGETNHSKSQERAIRGRIRKRIVAGFSDFLTLFRHLEARDRLQITKPSKGPERLVSDKRREQKAELRMINNRLMHMIAFGLVCADDMDIEFETLFEAALYQYAEYDHWIENVDVTVDIERDDPLASIAESTTERLKQKFNDGDYLSFAKILLLIERDEISREEAADYFRD